MEWALNTVALLYCASDSDMRAKMCAICLKGICLSVSASEQCYVLPPVVDSLHLSVVEFVGSTHDIPAVRMWRQSPSHIFKVGIVVSFGNGRVSAKLAVIEDNEEAAKQQQ